MPFSDPHIEYGLWYNPYDKSAVGIGNFLITVTVQIIVNTYAYSLGYCPQSYGLDYYRSGERNMKTLLRLRGFSNRKAQNVTKTWFKTIAAGTSRVQALKESMYREFSCFVNSEHLTTLSFTITEPKLAFNVIFVKLTLLATQFDDIVEDYSAYDGNLEDAFMHFLDENRYSIRPKETW
ncbi:unnamed protein product [Parnassius apollo]|uniref:(apollo) hypothetical protein n=1 Tax=Parnassius apollo TaxID=110799 RepID=A0A8S3WTB1_PARAO|nr:unnamed protein product [Parnassius apollo]